MRLTTYTDYSLRILIYLGTQPEQLTSIKKISDTFNISNNHLSKIIFELGKLGLVRTSRGRNGGIQLAKDPNDINLGYVIRQTEENLDIVECFDEKNNTCKISSSCRLKHIFKEALEAYFRVLNSYTLADVIINAKILKAVLNLND
jgi:Rrf2 family transcriptional regulator, nitric oxide-sensitive transcriptional repressor